MEHIKNEKDINEFEIRALRDKKFKGKDLGTFFDIIILAKQRVKQKE